MNNETTLREKLEQLPQRPGVYLFKDKKGAILYVGKAKVLRNRVRSYFQPLATLDPAKHQMVRQVHDLDTISCDSEHEALILEANLIRQHQPPYNVVLTDDKYYLFIKITKEEFPRIFPVRRIKKDGARYFGPYSSARAVRYTLKLLQRVFPHRGESPTAKDWVFPHPLFTDDTARRRPSRRTENLNQDEYKENIQQIIRFLEGKRSEVLATLQHGMRQAAHEHAFERAKLFRDQLQAIERLEGAQKVYLPRAESFDVISLVSQDSRSAANVFSVREGKLLQKNTFLLRHRTATSLADVTRQFLLQYYSVAQDIPATLFIPTELPDHAALAHWINTEAPPTLQVPQRGKKYQLLRMGNINAEQLLQSEMLRLETDTRLKDATKQLAQHLKFDPTQLHRIETYDISNIQGTLATGSLVVFVDGQALKSHYKRFRIKLTETPNDFAMLQEVLSRRFSHRHTDWPLPDLIIIDGGKGQLSAAQKILERFKVKVPAVALAKREEEIFTPGAATPLRLPYDSDALYLVQRMRDEAHRFAITYHKLLRSKRAPRSLLDEVPGIGPKLKQKLLRHFGSLKAIRAASLDELTSVVGQRKAEILQEHL